ncbi:MAG: SRPBCC domain-containing protein [Melioribacteraceae bacterium]|nr:SRPBCC domain-containing protein [Melioribacteraceae bacterium]
MKVSDELIIVEETFNSPIEFVWAALTEIEQMRLWYFDNIPSFKPEVGFKTQFDVRSETRNFTHKWKVTEIIPTKKIKYEWTYEGYTGRSTTLFELFSQENSTKLILTVEVLEDFPDDIPEFKRESCIGGWNYFINNRLKEYLNK